MLQLWRRARAQRAPALLACTSGVGVLTRSLFVLSPFCGLKIPIFRPQPDAFDCPANDEVCRVCFDGITQAFSKYTFHDEVWNNVQAMQPKDWLAVGLATLVLGLQIADKVVDTILGDVSRAQMQTIPGRSDWSKTKFPLEEVKYTVRRFGITPTVCATAYALVTCRGGGRGQCVPKHGRTRVLDPV